MDLDSAHQTDHGDHHVTLLPATELDPKKLAEAIRDTPWGQGIDESLDTGVAIGDRHVVLDSGDLKNPSRFYRGTQQITLGVGAERPRRRASTEATSA
jgi:hypothetical protein